MKMFSIKMRIGFVCAVVLSNMALGDVSREEFLISAEMSEDALIDAMQVPREQQQKEQKAEKQAQAHYRSNPRVYDGLLAKAKRGFSRKPDELMSRLNQMFSTVLTPEQIKIMSELIMICAKESAWATKAAITQKQSAQENLWQEWQGLQRGLSAKTRPFEISMDNDPALAMPDNKLIVIGVLLDALTAENTAEDRSMLNENNE